MDENKLDWYTPIIITETDFDPDQWGNKWYSVVFEGDASSHLWLAKEEPEVNKAYYGHFERTKSGKALRFKRDKEPEDIQRPANANVVKSDDKQYLKDLSDMPLRVYTASIPYTDFQGLLRDKEYLRELLEYVRFVSEELLSMSENIRGSELKAPEKPEKASESVLKDIKGDTKNPALRRGLEKHFATKQTEKDIKTVFGVDDEPLPDEPPEGAVDWNNEED